MILRRSSDGAAMVGSQPRRLERLAREQLTLRRRNDWRVQHDVGVPDGEGELSRRPVSLIAALYRVSPAAVYLGIEAARQLQADIAEFLARQD